MLLALTIAVPVVRVGLSAHAERTAPQAVRQSRCRTADLYGLVGARKWCSISRPTDRDSGLRPFGSFSLSTQIGKTELQGVDQLWAANVSATRCPNGRGAALVVLSLGQSRSLFVACVLWVVRAF